MLNCYLKCKHLDILNHRKEDIFFLQYKYKHGHHPYLDHSGYMRLFNINIFVKIYKQASERMGSQS